MIGTINAGNIKLYKDAYANPSIVTIGYKGKTVGSIFHFCMPDGNAWTKYEDEYGNEITDVDTIRRIFFPNEKNDEQQVDNFIRESMKTKNFNKFADSGK